MSAAASTATRHCVTMATQGRTLVPALMKSLPDGSRRMSPSRSVQDGISASAASAHHPLACGAIPAGVPELPSVEMATIDVDVSVDIDIDIASAPVPTSPSGTPYRSDSYSGRSKPECPEPNVDKAHSHVQRIKNIIGIVGAVSVGRVCRIPPASVHHRRIVYRNIDSLGTDRLDLDALSTDNDFLLLGGLEVSLGMGFGPQALDRIHDLGLLGHESVAHSSGPIHFIAHHGENLREGDQRLHAEIPSHAVQRGIERIALEIRILFYPLIRFAHLVGVGGRHQDLSEQGIRIKSDRSKHLVQLFLPKGCACCRVLSHCPGRCRHEQHEESDQASQPGYFFVHKLLLFQL